MRIPKWIKKMERRQKRAQKRFLRREADKVRQKEKKLNPPIEIPTCW